MAFRSATIRAVPTLPKLAERIYLAKRAAHVARLTDHRMTREAAERAVEAWVAEAATRGLPRDAPTFWTDGEAWILARR